MKTHKKLSIWQKALQFVKEFFASSEPLSVQEKGTINFQIKKLAACIDVHFPANNIHDAGIDWRNSFRDTLIASVEVQTHLLVICNPGCSKSRKPRKLELLVGQQTNAMIQTQQFNEHSSNYYIILGTI